MDSSEVQRWLRALLATRFSVIASATLLVYDHIISFDREVALIWARDWSFLKGVFIWHRYFGLLCIVLEMNALLNGVTAEFCSFWFQFESLGFTVAILSSELVLLLWIFVMYDRNRRIAATLVVLFAVEVISVFIIIGVSFSSFYHVRTDLIPDRPYCALDPARPPPLLWSRYWIPIFLYNFVIFVLFVFKGHQIFVLDRKRKLNSFMLKVYKNSVMNFAMMFSSYILCCVFWVAADFDLGQIPIVLALSLSVTNATRLLLNIRQGYFYYLGGNIDDETPLVHKGSGVLNISSVQMASSQGWMMELRELKWNGP